MINLNKNLIPIAIVAAGVLVAGAVLYINQEGTQAISSQEAGEKAIAFINQTIEENVTASLIDVVEDGSIYKIRLKIEDTEYESFITKDGKFLFPTGFSLEGQEVEGQKETLEEQTQIELTVLDDFAKCLTEKGMKFYGSETCGWCNEEKELFGDSMKYINYIECMDEETGEATAECRAEGIYVPGGLGVPTWQLPDGEMDSGFKTLKQLGELAGCPLE